ncbi:hypothetical protein PoB_004162700 [Plakobranchus ocellatus]|uniref:Uncharacterized protein n=1 Tax=Plakobranchus ocellatus TaxID=259542 RepID=A0AAV4B7R1_9GAST|nr:hypothetical protein PoB_004162700 [Plakobranchus ocellatus]
MSDCDFAGHENHHLAIGIDCVVTPKTHGKMLVLRTIELAEHISREHVIAITNSATTSDKKLRPVPLSRRPAIGKEAKLMNILDIWREMKNYFISRQISYLCFSSFTVIGHYIHSCTVHQQFYNRRLVHEPPQHPQLHSRQPVHQHLYSCQTVYHLPQHQQLYGRRLANQQLTVVGQCIISYTVVCQYIGHLYIKSSSVVVAGKYISHFNVSSFRVVASTSAALQSSAITSTGYNHRPVHPPPLTSGALQSLVSTSGALHSASTSAISTLGGLQSSGSASTILQSSGRTSVTSKSAALQSSPIHQELYSRRLEHQQATVVGQQISSSTVVS